MEHHLHRELRQHLCADDPAEKQATWANLSRPSMTPAGRPEASGAHRPLKRIQPANTRGQRWQACRMRAALRRRSESTCRTQSELPLFLLRQHDRMLRHSQRKAQRETETHVGAVDGLQAGEDVMELRGARLKVRQVLSPAACQNLLAGALQGRQAERKHRSER